MPIENVPMVVDDVNKLIGQLENARFQQCEYLIQNNTHAGLSWARYASQLYRQAARAVNGYRAYCDRQPGRLEYLEGVVAEWEKRLDACVR